MRILKAILLFPIRLVFLPVRLLLLVGLCFWGAIGGFIETVTSILGFIMMVTSAFGVIAKIIDGPIFVEMFLEVLRSRQYRYYWSNWEKRGCSD